ncbi:MAG: SDR family oxidoreductase [Thermoguttaceae bacterium]
MARREIQGSRAILTGASSGIGRALALELARSGARLILIARRQDRLRELSEQLTCFGAQVELVAGDVTDPVARQRLVQAAECRFGGLDILVNNAGIGALGRFEDADPARLRRIMEVNFFAPVELTRLALPMLKQASRPIVVNIGSILGHRAVPFSSEYCASKFALRGFSEALRSELARHRIDLLMVSPGSTQTEFFAHLIEKTAQPGWPQRGSVSADYVARKTVQAIRQGRAEIIPSTWGWLVCLVNRFSPQLVDRVLARYG